MKDSLPFDLYPTFIIRTPLLPFSFLKDLQDNERVLDKIRTIALDPVINEALFVASPEFHNKLKKCLDYKESNLNNEERLCQTFYKYLSRMASRCTPFGLFAGCGVGSEGEETNIILSEIQEFDRHTRLDMVYLCNLAQSLEKDQKIKIKLRYFPNTTLYKSGEKLRYIEYRYKRDFRTHHLIEIKNSEFLEMILSEAREGKTVRELEKFLLKEDIPLEQSYEYINNLIDNQIIISELDPTVTGSEFLDRIMNILIPIKPIENVTIILNQTKKKLDLIDKMIGNSPDLYYEIASDLKQLGVDYNIKYLFQTDLNLKLLRSTIDKSVFNSLKEVTILFNKLTLRNGDSRISQFIEAYLKRYETRECPLLNVLDTETGIGYLQVNRNSGGDISTLIADLVMPYKEVDSMKFRWDKVQEFLFNKYKEANEKQYYEIEITDADVISFPVEWSDLPVTFCCLAKLIEGPSKKYPAGRIFVSGAGGLSASRLLGRFCHGNKEILDFVKEICEFEDKMVHDAITAEIVHLPESRIGNVILRPILRNYEIPFLTSPAVDPEHTISLDDIYISVRNKKIILRSKRLNKVVVPYLSNAHNHLNSTLPVYQFLCDLQTQDKRSSIGFDWGTLRESYYFKPRVLYKNLIISAASWKIRKDDIDAFYRIKDDKELLVAVKEWREKKKMPEQVLLDMSDNALFVTFKNILSIRTLLSSVKKMDSFILEEFLFDPDNAIVKNNDGIFTNELVFAFYKKSED